MAARTPRPQPAVVEGELEHGAWVQPAEAWEAWHRGDVLAAPPILHILEVLSQDGPLRGLDRLRDPAETNLGPFRRVEMRPGVLMFPLLTHTLPPAVDHQRLPAGTARRRAGRPRRLRSARSSTAWRPPSPPPASGSAAR